MNYKLLLNIILVLIFSACKSNNKTESVSTDNEQKQEETNRDEIQPASNFGGLMTELEANIGWQAVSSSWKDRRDSWVSDCLTATSTKSKADLLMEFESIVNWDAVDKTWADRRESWIYNCENAKDDSELAKNLMEFESYILWDAVSAEWPDIRDNWTQKCLSIESTRW